MKALLCALVSVFVVVASAFAQGNQTDPGTLPTPAAPEWFTVDHTVDWMNPLDIEKSFAQLRWAEIEGAVIYEIDAYSDRSFFNESQNHWWNICKAPAEWGGQMKFGLFRSDPIFSVRGTFGYRVRAVFPDGKKTAYTPEIMFTIQPDFLEEGAVMAYPTGTTDVFVEWGTYEGAIGYEVWEKRGSGSKLLDTIPADTVFAKIKNLYSNSYYSFMVRAILPDGKYSEFAELPYEVKTYLPIDETPPQYKINQDGEIVMTVVGEDFNRGNIRVSSNLKDWSLAIGGEVIVEKVDETESGVPIWEVTLKKDPSGKSRFMRMIIREFQKGNHPPENGND